MARVVFGFIRNLRQQMHEHPDLVPLMGAFVGAAMLSGSCMVYTAVNKEDVSWNRWGNPFPADYINPEKHEQKLYLASTQEKELYKRDVVVENLRKEVYSHLARDIDVNFVKH